MADVPFSDVVGGASSGFVPTFVSGSLSIASGSSGDILTITPPAGKRARLMALMIVSGQESGITVSVGGNEVIDSKTLTTAVGNGRFQIGVSSDGDDTSVVSCPYLEAQDGESIVVTKDSGSTGSVIFYSYMYGD